MGHIVLNDAQSVDWLHRHITDWGKRLPEMAQWKQRPRFELRGRSFNATLAFTPDQEKADGSLQIEVRLKRTGPGRHRERFLYVGLEQVQRRLDQPRVWRLRPAKKLTRHRKLLYVQLSRDIYWSPQVPPDDLRAQITIALMQLGCIPSDSELRNWLTTYVQKFRILAEKGLSARDRRHDRNFLAALAVATLIENFSFPEDYRGFRRYIAQTLRFQARKYRENIPGMISTDVGADIDWHGSLDQDWDSDENLRGLRTSTSRTLNATGPDDKWTVADAASHLNLSASYIYRLIKEGAIAAEASRAGLQLLRSEVVRLSRVLSDRCELRENRDALEKLGKTNSAARKAIYRKHGRAPSFHERVTQMAGVRSSDA